jgi:hypothetical protein
MMNALIRWTFRLWFGHQQDSVKGAAEASNSRDIADKAGNYNSVEKDTFALGITGNLTGYGERNFANAVEEAKEGRVLEINKRGISACNCGNLARDARNIFDDRFLGFVGHDGVPWLWESSKECGLPVTESSRAHAAAYAPGPYQGGTRTEVICCIQNGLTVAGDTIGF